MQFTAPRQGWFALMRDHTVAHWPAATGLGVALLVVLGMSIHSLVRLATGDPIPGLQMALLGGLAGFATTTLGALPALVVRSMPQKLEDSLLGLAAGMMLAAAAFSLLLPGLDAATEFTGSRAVGSIVVVTGLALGVMLMLGLDSFTPHEHSRSGVFGPVPARMRRIWLFVLAIALHNLPEGMAVGVAFGRADLEVGLPVAVAIALQDIPEGLAVALALRAAGYSPRLSVFVASASGLLEPLGALLGVTLSSGLVLAYPAGLGLAAGAMIFVVSHEVIPETHRNGHETPATLGLMAGFALMMVLDTALG